MFTALNILAVTALVLLAIIVVVKIKEFAQSQDRRQVASPYGMIRAPSDKRLRRTREEHPMAYEIMCQRCGEVPLPLDGNGAILEGSGGLCTDCWYKEHGVEVPNGLEKEGEDASEKSD